MTLSPHNRGLRLAWLIMLVLSATSAATAQEGLAQSEAEDPVQALSSQAGPAGTEPDVFLIPDETGKLRRVVGATYEELMRAWSGRPGAAANAPPGAVVEQLSGTVDIGEEDALVRLRAVVRKTTAGRVRAPLLMPGLMIEQSSLTPEQGVLAVEPGTSGYALWLWGPQGERFELELKGRVRLRQQDETSLLKLSVPSAVSQRLELHFEQPVSVLRSSPGVRAVAGQADRGTTLEAVGGVSPIEVEWSEPRSGELSEPTVLTADSLVRVEVQNDRVLCTADIRTQTPASARRGIRVRLPEGFRAAEGVPGQRRVEGNLLELSPLKDDGDGRRYRLVCEAPSPGSSVSSSLSMPAFEILGAYTQQGRVEVASTDRLRVFCQMQGNLRQVPLGEPEAAPDAARPVGRYEFGGTDWVLKLTTDPVRRVVRVRPAFDLRLAAGHAELIAEFDYLMTGPGDSLLRVALNQWKIIDAPEASGDALDASRCYVSSDGTYVMHLRSPATTSTRVRLKLRRDSQGGQRQFSLPEPIGGSVLPGSMTVDADPELVLNPDPKAMVGLSSLARTDRSALADGAFYYRTFFREVAFATRVSQRPVRLDIDLLTAVAMENGEAAVTQQYSCAVQYGQVRELELLVPRGLLERGVVLELREGEQWRPLDTAEAAAALEADGAAQDAAAPVRVRLDSPLEGLSEFGVRYLLPVEPDATRRPTAWDVPLCAVEANSLARQVTVRTPPGYVCDLAGGPYATLWSRDPAAPDQGGATLFSSSGQPWAIALSVSPVGQASPSRAEVEKAWLQSWVVAGVQQDRQRFRLRGEGELRLRLPAAAAGLPIEAKLDGLPVEVQEADDAVIRIPLPNLPDRSETAEDSAAPARTLEVRWLRPLRAGLPSVSPMQIDGADADFPVVWELVLPPGQVLGRIPEGFTSSAPFGERPRSQESGVDSEIARWMDWPDEEAAPWSGSRYVLVALSQPAETRVFVFSRAWLVLLTAFGFFATLALAAYLEARSRIALVTAALAVLAVCSTVWPHLAPSLTLGVFGGGAAAGAATLLRRYTALGQDASGGASLPGVTDSATHSWTGAHPTAASQAGSGVEVSARSSA